MISADNQQATRLEKVGESSETKCQTSHLNSELATLVALLFTDGCVSPKTIGKSWRICFANKSQNLIELFRNCVIAVFDIDPSRIKIVEKKNANGMFTAIVNSKEIGDTLVSRFGTFRTLKFNDGTLPDAQLPVKDLIASNCIEIFLQTAFSCDGGISFYPVSWHGKRWLIRTIFLSCAHPNLRSDYMELLDALDIVARNVADDGKIKIENMENIKKFQEKIGFAEGTMVTDHSKFWRGYTKQAVLDLMIASYQDLDIIYNLPQFKRDEDIVQPA
jgi:hypothetical protein